MNPLLEKYMKDKYGENYEADAQSKYDEAGERANVGGLFSNIGDAIAGNKVGSQNAFFEQRRKDAREDTLGKIEKSRKSGMEDMVFGNQMEEAKAKAEKRDPLNQRNVAWRAAVKANVPELAKSMSPEEFDQLTIEDSEAIMNPVKWRLEKEGRAAQLAAMQGARRDARDASLEEKHRVENEKKADKELRLAVPGYERTGEVLPKDEEAMKLRSATASGGELVSKLREMKALVEKYGSYESGGKGGAKMKGLARDIQLLSKGPELYQLGVLAGPDMEILDDVISNPSSWDSMFTRDSTRQSQIDTQLNSLETKLAAKAKSLGYKPQAVAPKPGDEVDGYVFQGGDPANKNAWVKK